MISACVNADTIRRDQGQLAVDHFAFNGIDSIGGNGVLEADSGFLHAIEQNGEQVVTEFLNTRNFNEYNNYVHTNIMNQITTEAEWLEWTS